MTLVPIKADVAPAIRRRARMRTAQFGIGLGEYLSRLILKDTEHLTEIIDADAESETADTG